MLNYALPYIPVHSISRVITQVTCTELQVGHPGLQVGTVGRDVLKGLAKG